MTSTPQVTDDSFHDDTIAEMTKRLIARGFIVGPRDPRRNRGFIGAFMVAQPLAEHLLPTDTATSDVWCVVGDSLAPLVMQTFANFYAGE